MTKDEITTWALANGWQMIDGMPSLTKPSAPHPAIVRLVLKATVASLEIKKPAGKWDKVANAPYSRITADPDTGMPDSLGLGTISGLTVRLRMCLITQPEWNCAQHEIRDADGTIGNNPIRSGRPDIAIPLPVVEMRVMHARRIESSI